MNNKLYYILFFLILFNSCENGVKKKKILSENTGKQNEIILVVKDQYWEGAIGDILRGVFEAEILGLPQSEKLFNLVQINPDDFGRFFRTHKNIIFIREGIKDSYTKNKWAKSQIVMYLNSQSTEINFLGSCKKALNYLNKKEIENIKYTYKKGHNSDARKYIKSNFGIELFLPTEYTVSLKDSQLFVSDFHSFNEKQDLLKYILVYDFIPRSSNIEQELVIYTDSILRTHIHGAVEGTYVQLDNRISISDNNGLFRGMWTLKNGFMAGPFIMKYRYIENRIVVSLGLVFYPNEKKRSYVRTFEAIL